MNLSPSIIAYSDRFRPAIGKRLRCARVALGRSQDGMARELGIARQTLAGYENGHSEPLSSLLARLCEDFGLDPAWLLAGASNRPMFATDAIRPQNALERA